MADTPTGSGSNGGTTTVVANPPNPPTTNTVPNTTTDAKTVQYQSAVTESVFDPRQDVGENVFDPGQTYNGPATEESVFDPRQDPAESVFNPGGPYNGPATQESVFDPRQDVGENVFNPNAAVPNPAVTAAAQFNDPYAGLSPRQLQDLGGADPTDPYIRARLGIPQLPGSTLNATPGFGFGNITTNFPSIDGALGTIGSLFGGLLGGGAGGGAGLSSLFTNFSSTVGGLFGGKPTASTVASTTGAGVAGLTAPAASTAELGKQATKVLATDSNLTADAKENLVNIDGANAEIAKANANIAANNNAISANLDSQSAALEQQRQAQAIIDQNNAELADDTLPDSRRAELEANNAAQRATIAQNAAVIDEAQNNIDTATLNTQAQEASILTNEVVAQENADAFVINNDGAGPTQVSAFEDPGIQENVFDPGVGPPQSESVFDPRQDPAETIFDPGATFNGPATQESVFDPRQDVGEAVFDPGETFNADGESVFDPENVDPNSDPFEEARFQAQLAAQEDVPIEFDPADVPVGTDEEAIALEAQQAENRRILATEAIEREPGIDPGENVFNPGETFNADGESVFNPAAVDSNQDLQNERNDAAATDAANSAPAFGFNPDSEEIANESATRERAKKQATVQARYKQPGNEDWRVRLSLGPGAQYLYNAGQPGILAPLKADGGTDGVIFPYTPTITTTYSANYEQYDLIHSNYRGIFYKSSRVGDIQVRGTFTAQNTTEANYLLAVIHFFRSATKMFYGQDVERGTPPPICLLNGFGGYQFSNHPVVISSFNYTLPNDVDYIRTTNPNNFGLNLNNRYNPAGASLPAGGSLAGLNRLLNAIPGGLKKGALPTVPAPNTVVGSVTNNTPSSYVPTKMEIDITLIPVQSRSQVSQQFSLKGFANGDLLKGGFW